MDLKNMLKGFDVPEWRMDLNKNNLIWLEKNLDKRNSENPDFHKVLKSLQHLLKNKAYKK